MNNGYPEKETFYLHIPQTDYIDDIEIQDEHENSNYEDIHGLSEEQVSQLANDSLDQTAIPKSPTPLRSLPRPLVKKRKL
jgi:hypothetical protein